MFTKSNKYLRQKLANWVNLEKKDRFCKKTLLGVEAMIINPMLFIR